MFGQNRDQLRRFYHEAWNKKQHGAELSPLETMVASVIELHPEYHSVVEDLTKTLTTEKVPGMGETNPFLHMGMHLALHEQISTNRPAGIKEIYQSYCKKHDGAHEAEHQMMESLGEVLWEAQRFNRMPDEQRFLELLKERL